MLVRCFTGRWAGTPGASAVIADPHGKCLFVDYEAYEVGCELDDTPALFAGSDSGQPERRWTNAFHKPGIPEALKWPIIADSARPETIAFMQKRGFQMRAATKGAGSVEEGIATPKNFDIWVHPRCKWTAIELARYSYVVNRTTGAVEARLADKDNHAIDALRYATQEVRRGDTSPFEYVRGPPRITSMLSDAERDIEFIEEMKYAQLMKHPSAKDILTVPRPKRRGIL